MVKYNAVDGNSKLSESSETHIHTMQTGICQKSRVLKSAAAFPET
jgi:hypothetical protein